MCLNSCISSSKRHNPLVSPCCQCVPCWAAPAGPAGRAAVEGTHASGALDSGVDLSSASDWPVPGDESAADVAPQGSPAAPAPLVRDGQGRPAPERRASRKLQGWHTLLKPAFDDGEAASCKSADKSDGADCRDSRDSSGGGSTVVAEPSAVGPSALLNGESAEPTAAANGKHVTASAEDRVQDALIWLDLEMTGGLLFTLPVLKQL